MKIAVASSGKDLNSPVDLRFGRCPYFLIGDIETGKFEGVENSAIQSFRGAGISAAQMVVNKGVKVVIAGNFGPNALNVFQTSGVKVFRVKTGVSVKEVIESYKAGRLEEVETKSMDFSRSFSGRRGGRW
jgi:predicted Fe-Mo cluster-binding NifX family protein